MAKLDRLARNAEFLLSVVRESGDGGVVFTDLPQLPAGASGKFILTLFAAVAELEAGLISQRARAALAAAKARGVKLGNPRLRAGSSAAIAAARQARTRYAKKRTAELLPYIDAARRAGAVTLREIADAMEFADPHAKRANQLASGNRASCAARDRATLASCQG